MRENLNLESEKMLNEISELEINLMKRNTDTSFVDMMSLTEKFLELTKSVKWTNSRIKVYNRRDFL